MTTRRVIAWSLVVTTLASSCLASASALGGISGGVGAGDAPITGCDADGFSVAYATQGGNVESVTVSGIADPGCEGGALSVTVTNSAGDSIASGGPGAIGVDGDTANNSATVAVSPNPPAEQVSGHHVSVVGP